MRSIGPARARDGFILAVVVGLSIIIGMLVFAYYQSFRHRDVQVRLSSDRASARYLARACVDALKFAFHEAPDPKALQTIDVEGGSLLPFLMGDSASLKIRVAKKVDGKTDHRDFIQQLVGKDNLEPIDKLVAKLPDARVEMFVDLRPLEMWPGNTGKVLTDPVYKTVQATYRVEAHVRKAYETFRTTDTIDVHSLLPPAISKFTFALTADGAVNLNTHQVTTRGEDAGGGAPVVLFHSPEDGDPVVENPFEPRPTGQKAMPGGVAKPEDLLSGTANRGMVFLPGTPESPVNLQLASGGTPFGEYHSVYQPTSGRTSFPAGLPLPEQPAKTKRFRAPDPNDPTVQQGCAIQGAAFGFFQGIDEHGMLGGAPSGMTPEMCAQLKVYGTGTHPSSGAVVGWVYRAMAGLSDIGIDRDETAKDESEQQAACGRQLPVRDGIDPFLKNVSAAAYDADIELERSGSHNYRSLSHWRTDRRHPTTGQPIPGIEGQVDNENALIDADGDGRRETVVTSEALHSPIGLDLTKWKYGQLFEKYEEYSGCMSKYVIFPANLSVSVGAQPLEKARETILSASFGKNLVNFRDWLLTEPRLEPRDTLHQQLATRGATKYYLDGKGQDIKAIAETIKSGAAMRYPSEVTYIVKGQRKFEEIFMPGGTIDLQGLKVMVIREKPEDKPVLEFDADVSVKPGSGGTLVVERFKAKSLKNPGERENYAPFVLQTQQLILAGKGPYEGIIVPQSIEQERVTEYSVIRGSLAVGAMPSALMTPLVVQYDPRNDPLAKDATLYYRAQFRKDPRTYDVEDRQ